MALATLLAVSLGTWVLKSGRRRVAGIGPTRTLSLFQLGLRWSDRIFHERFMPGLYLYPLEKVSVGQPAGRREDCDRTLASKPVRPRLMGKSIRIGWDHERAAGRPARDGVADR